MKSYESDRIRNIVLAGHASKGKTTLAEAMLYLTGNTDRLGRVPDGNTVMDSDPEEKKRGVSIGLSVAPLEYEAIKMNLIDTPGLFDFAQSVNEGMRVADTALIVMSAKSGLGVGAEKAFQLAGKRGMARVFVTSKMDGEHADFYKVFNNIAAVYGSSVCPVVVPVISDGKVAGYYNMVTDETVTYENGKAVKTDSVHDDSPRFDAIKAVFAECVAGADEALMEKYFEGAPFTSEEKWEALRSAMAAGSIYPLLACSGYTGDGVDMLLDFLAHAAPAPGNEYGTDDKGEPVEIVCDPDGPLCALCFKTIADPFIGKLSFVKVLAGQLKGDTPVVNSRTGAQEKLGKLVFMRGSKQEDTPAICAGDIGAVTKLANVSTGDTLCAPNRKVTLDGITDTLAAMSMAVEVLKKGEEEKAAAGLLRLCEEDPSLHFSMNPETKQQILSGTGEQQLDVTVSKLKSKFGVEVTLSVPRVAYRETITRKVSAQGRHKKQSGGHGQFGDVFIEFEPCDSEGLEFCERVVGGAVPKNFFPAVEKGLHDCIQRGVLASYPMVGLRATLYDGSYHPVDSSEMSFKMAASLAYKNGIQQAGPVLLEPIGTLKVYVNDETMGDMMGDINKRRGRVLGMSSIGDGMQEILAETPMAEMANFATSVRQITQGRGYFTLTFERYERVPEHIAQKIIEQAQSQSE